VVDIPDLKLMGRQAHNLKVVGSPLLKELVPESYNLTTFILYVTYCVKDVNDIYFILEERMRVALTILMMAVTTTNSAAGTVLKDSLALIEQHKACSVLIFNGRLKKFGLPLQFEIDSEFYSKENRLRRAKVYAEMLNEKLNGDQLSKDEQYYFKQKSREINMKEGVVWGVKSSMGEGIASWDEPYRNCVREFNLDG